MMRMACGQDTKTYT